MINEEIKLNKSISLSDLFAVVYKYKYKLTLISIIIILISLVYVMSLPNVYRSNVVLITNESKTGLSSNFSSLASFAGIELDSNSKSPYVMMNTILKDYSFHINLIKKYNLVNRLNNDKNFVFAFNYDKVYRLLKSDEKNIKLDNDVFFSVAKNLMSMVKVEFDKKTNIIILSVTHSDRNLAKELVDIYLNSLISKIREQDMREIDKQIKYYKKELDLTYNVLLKEQLSKSLSSLMQKKVFSQANDFYTVSKVVNSRVSNISEKLAPRRSSVIIMSLFTGMIIVLVIIFFIEYLRKNEEN